MITCKNVTFIHVPKCGGTYVRTILDSYYSSHSECALPEKSSVLPSIGFIRNPYSWYVSWYNFKNSGSDIYKGSEIYKMCNKGDITFEAYLENLIHPTMEFKQRYLSVIQTFDLLPALYQVAAGWLKSDKPYYEYLYDRYLLNSQVYKSETMTQSLPKILDDLGMLTDDVKEKLVTTPRINISKTVDYKSYYTPELSALISDNHQRILTTYDYSL